MSGAAVWAADRIVAVVAEHHPSEGTGRLTARRIDQAYDQLSKPDVGRLVHWLGLPSAISGLRDVVPAGPGQLVRSAYLEQVRDIAPDALSRPRGRTGGVDRVLRWPRCVRLVAGRCVGREDRAGVLVCHSPPGRGGHRVVLYHRPPGRSCRQPRIPGCHDRAAHRPGSSRRGIASRDGGAGRHLAEPAGIGISSCGGTGSAACRGGGRA